MWNEITSDELIDSAPLYRALLAYQQKSPARFHTPGHKASSLSPLYALFGDSLQLDATELPETDSLFDAAGPIREAEKRASEEFGTSSTLFSAGGATLCIQTMLRLVSERFPQRRRILCARNVHRSVVNAMCLLGLEPVWVWPRRFPHSALPGTVAAEDIARLLGGGDDFAAVFLTSPDYYGVLSDIGAISAVCKKYGVPLLVDNSHGSHLLYLGGQPDNRVQHPLLLGADMTCDSAHKTLPVLTGGAFLQIADPAYPYRRAKSAMALFGSTSPSYLIMASLDVARAWLSRNGREAFGSLAQKVAALHALASKKGFFRPENASFDPVRITLDFSSVGSRGGDAAEEMRRAGISAEMCDDCHIVLLPSPFNPDADFDRLARFIRAFSVAAPLPPLRARLPAPAKQMPLREACLAPAEAVSVERCAGRIAAECRAPCPPGIPLVMPGETISAPMAACLKKYGVFTVNVIK